MKFTVDRQTLRNGWPLIALLVAVLFFEGIDLMRGDALTPAVKEVPVSSTRLVCPVSETSRAAGDLVFAGVLVSSDAAASSGEDVVSATSLAPELEDISDVVIPTLSPALTGGVAGAVSSALPPASVPVVVEGAGGLAAGTAAAVTHVARSGDDRGLATVPCGPAATSWWFIGGQSTLGRLTRLVITNPDLAPATFDIVVYDAKGIVDAPAGRGLTVAAQSRMEVRLDALAPNNEATAFHVQSSSGRVHAAVLLRAVDGLTPLGSEWLPATTPATRIVIPIPPGLRNIDATFMAHREVPSDFSLQVRTPAGVFTPSGAEGLTLAADSVLSLPMDDALAEGGALEISSNVGIVAGITATSVGSGLTDLVAFGSAPAIAGMALTTGVRSEAAVTLTVAAWNTPATARITIIAADGSQQSQELTVAPDAVSQVQIAPAKSGPTTVMINSAAPISASLTTVIQAGEGVLATGVTLERRATFVSAPDARLVVGIQRRASDTD